MKSEKFCLACNAELQGRADKKFCDPHCKSAYHYEKDRRENNFFLKVDRQLKINRKLLRAFNKAGKATVRSQTLIDRGFDPSYFTHYWKNNRGEVYLFVYEYGFLSKIENGKKKYILVTWQPYMEK
ncbi:hypothetical protein [Salinimicrobium soli]|uniref:hypothetical protein n=1 Tax=Salinimicrobium soli TaxID=1254399 RepID=UPI003AAC6752